MLFTIGGFTLDDTVTPDGRVIRAAPGGNALYAAVGARVWTEEVGIVSPVGCDYPQEHLDRLAQAGFNLDGVRRIDEPGFHVWILHEGDGKRQIIYRLDSGDNKTLDPRPEDLPPQIGAADAAHLCPILGASQAALAEALLDRSVPATLDLIVVPDQIDVSRGHDRSIWPGLLALLPSVEEVRALFGDLPLGELIEALRAVGPQTFAVKLGEHGSVVNDPARGRLFHVPAYPAEVTDATGAGDSFCGGFLAGIRELGDPVEAALRGTVSASFVIEDFGALHALDRSGGQAAERLAALHPEVRPIEESPLVTSLDKPWRQR
jgi:ribokinase